MTYRVFTAITSLFLLSLTFTPAAQARDWFRAESEHFIVYSEDTEVETREFVQDLERLDEVLRILTGVGQDDGSLPESSKVTVFRFGTTQDMSSLAANNRNSGIGGFFMGRASGSVAFVPRARDRGRERSAREGIDTDMQLDPKATLFHEYVHYFMFQHRDAPYPLWYSEGFAELFSNVQFEEDHFVIGEVPTWRSAALATISIDLEDTFDPPARGTRETVGRTYAHGWLIASHLNLNPERRGQMTAYMEAIGQGRTPMEAAETAFGDLRVLRRELEEFRQGRARTLRVPYAVEADPALEIRRLDEAEAARMDLMIISERGVDFEEAQYSRGTGARTRGKLSPEHGSATGRHRSRIRRPQLRRSRKPCPARAGNRSRNRLRRRSIMLMSPCSHSFTDPAQLREARTRFAAANRMETTTPIHFTPIISPICSTKASRCLNRRRSRSKRHSPTLRSMSVCGRL